MLSLKRNLPKSRGELGSGAGCCTGAQPGRQRGAVLQGLGPGYGLAQHFYQSVCIPANISHNAPARPVHLAFEGCFQVSIAAKVPEGIHAPSPTPKSKGGSTEGGQKMHTSYLASLLL